MRGDAAEIAARLTKAQKRALEWLATTDHWKSTWTVQGKPVRSEPFEEWSHLRVSGKAAILIESDALWALDALIEPACTKGRMWGLTPLGAEVRAIIAEQEAARDG